MSIKYSLHPDTLKNEKSGCIAKVKTTSSAELEDIIGRMSELGSTVTRADSMAVLEDCTRAIESLLLEGHRVNLGGLVQMYPTIKGNFTSRQDSFDEARHRIHVSARAGTRIKNKLQNEGKVVKVQGKIPRPHLSEFRDISTDTRNSTATAGSIGQVWGINLKYNPDTPDEGIFFENTKDKNRIRVTQVQKNRPKELVFMIPAELKAGSEYTIEIRTRIKNSSRLRTGTLAELISVAG